MGLRYLLGNSGLPQAPHLRQYLAQPLHLHSSGRIHSRRRPKPTPNSGSSGTIGNSTRPSKHSKHNYGNTKPGSKQRQRPRPLQNVQGPRWQQLQQQRHS